MLMNSVTDLNSSAYEKSLLKDGPDSMKDLESGMVGDDEASN